MCMGETNVYGCEWGMVESMVIRMCTDIGV